MSVTKPYFVHLITEQSETPYLWGMPQPEPALKVPQVNSAGYGNRKGDPQNKTIFDSLKPQTFPLIGARVLNQITPKYDAEYTSLPTYGPHIRNLVRF